MTNAKRRPWWEFLLGMIVLHVAMVGFTCLIVERVRIDSHRKEGLLEFARTLGRSAAQDLSNGLNIAAAIQLAVLIVLVGGQVVAPNAKAETGLRSSLLILALAPLLATAPAMTLAAIASTNDTDTAGRMFAIAPHYLVQIAICVFIGTFQLGSPSLLLKIARKDHRRAALLTGALERLPHFSSRPRIKIAATVATFTATCSVPTSVGFHVVYVRHFLENPSLGIIFPMVTQYASIVSLLNLLYLLCIFITLGINTSLKPGSDRVSIFFLAAFMALIEVSFIGLTITTWNEPMPVSVGIAGSALSLLWVSIMSTVEGMSSRRILSGGKEREVELQYGAPRGYSWWQGRHLMAAGTSWSLLSARSAHKRSSKRISDLCKQIEDELEEEADLSS